MFRSVRVRRYSFVFASLFVAASAHAEGLTADEVARRATSSSFMIEEGRHDVEAAKAQLDKACDDYFPRLSSTATAAKLSPIDSPTLGNIVVAQSPGPVTGPTVAVPLSFNAVEHSISSTTTLNVPLSDYVFRLGPAHAAAKAQVESSQQSLEATQRKTAFDARALYYDWVKAELEIGVAQQNLDLGKEHLDRVQKLAAAESAAEADVARVQSTVASSELVLVQAKNLADLQRARLRIVMHGTSTFTIGETFDGVAPAVTDDIEAGVRLATANRPELKALAARTRSYEKQAAAIRAQGLPRLDAFAQGTVANPNSRYLPPENTFHATWQVGATLTLSPNDILTSGAQRDAQLAKAAASAAEERQLQDSVRREVTEAVISHRNAVAAVESTAKRLGAAETSYRSRRARFLADAATTVELTEAQTDLFRARLDAVEAKVAVRLASAQVAYATGRAQ